MSWVAVGVAGVSAAGSIFSGVMGSSASKKQAEAQTKAAQIASQTALQIDDKARGDIAPFRQLGVQSGDMMSKILSGEMSLDDVLGKSSIFKWQQAEGERGINRQLAARGEYNSGAGLETLARFNSQLTAEEGSRYWDRLFNTTTLGANAASHMATNTTQAGSVAANAQLQGGMAAGQSIGDAGRSIASIGPGVANAAGQGLQYQLYKPFFDRYNKNSGDGMMTDPKYGTPERFGLTSD